MRLTRSISFLIISSSLLVLQVKSDVDIITRLCKYDWCYSLDQNNSSYSSEEYYLKLFKLFSSGIPQLIYEELENVIPQIPSLSTSCSDSFKVVSRALDSGYEWAFRLIDSSGKIPAGFTEGTITSLGDYDECLELKSPAADDIHGKYCLTDIFPIGYKNGLKRSDGKISLNSMQHFNASAYYFGLCFPSKCSTDDVRKIVQHVLKPYPLMVEGDLNCDTKETNTMAYRLKNASLGTKISLSYIALMGLLIFYGTFNHIFRPTAAKENIWNLKSFSIIENIHKLLVVNKDTRPDGFLTWFKMMIVVFGVCAHVMCCLESPIGFFILSHHKNLERMISDPIMMPIFGDAGITIITALSGYGTFVFAFPLAQKGKLPIISAVLDKTLRLLPSVLSIMALDFCWYLPFDGPFVNRVGNIIVDKCSKTWWKTALFISNLWGPTIEICSGHTYSTAVDVQLFVIGLIGVLLLAKKPKTGVMYCTCWALLGTVLMLVYSHTHKLTPTLMVARNPYIHNLEMFLMYVHMATSSYLPSYFLAMLTAYYIEKGVWKHLAQLTSYDENSNLEMFLMYVHMATSSYLPSYFLAMLTAYYIEKGVWKHLAQSLKHYRWIIPIAICNLTIQFSPALTNYFDAIPQHLNPLFIVSNRLIVAVEMALIFIYISLLEEKNKLTKDSDKLKEDPNKNELIFTEDDNFDGVAIVKLEGTERYSVLKAFFRLSFAIYMSNYLFIRTDFFTERNIFYNSLYVYVKRLVSSAAFIYVVAFLFHIFYVAPFMNLMNEIQRRPKVVNNGTKETKKE